MKSGFCFHKIYGAEASRAGQVGKYLAALDTYHDMQIFDFPTQLCVVDDFGTLVRVTA